MTERADRIRTLRLGRERFPLLVVEDLLSDPAPMLELAWRSRFGPPRVEAFPGLRAPAPGRYVELLRRSLSPLLADAFNLPGYMIASAASDFSLVTKRPEALALRQRIPHTDGVEPGLIAVMHYLTPGGFSGTSSYRHRSSGFERVGAERRPAYEAALAADLACHPPEGFISGDTPVFERIGGVEGRFNRLLAYPGTCLHSGDVPDDFGFQADPRHGRLTVNTFFVMRPMTPRAS